MSAFDPKRTLEKSELPLIEVQVPFGVHLEDNIVLEINTGETMNISYKQCINTGCFASGFLDQTMLSRFKVAEQGIIRFTSFQGDKLALPFSLNGFTPALEKLN